MVGGVRTVHVLTSYLDTYPNKHSWCVFGSASFANGDACKLPTDRGKLKVALHKSHAQEEDATRNNLKQL
jgi:hypothetical protein